jgi:hypothetical protein
VPVAALLGASTDGFRLGAPAPGLELNGVALEHLTYALGAAAGATVDGQPTLQAWARLGALFSGAEAGFWHDAALGVDLFGAQATSRLAFPPVGGVTEDSALVLGAALHLQLQAWELDAGFYAQRHVSTGSRGALALVQYDELSFIAFPWLVAAVRVDYAHLAATGLAPAWSLRVTPGVAVLFRQNVKATLTAQFEAASGILPGGWGPAGGLASPSPDRQVIALETETVMLNLAAAF